MLRVRVGLTVADALQCVPTIECFHSFRATTQNQRFPVLNGDCVGLRSFCSISSHRRETVDSLLSKDFSAPVFPDGGNQPLNK